MFFYYFPETNEFDSLFKMSYFDIENPFLRKKIINKDPNFINLKNSSNYWSFYINIDLVKNPDFLLNDILNFININKPFDSYIFHIRVYNNNHEIIYPFESSDKNIELYKELYDKSKLYIKNFNI